MRLSRCWTRNDPCPTFHRATPRPQLRKKLGLRRREGEQFRGHRQLPGRLGVDDACLRVGQQPLGQCHLLGVRRAHRVQVGHAVEHRHVGDAEGTRKLPGRLEPPRHTQIGEQRPGFVDHHERPLPSPGVRRRPGQVGLEPRRGAGHENSEGGRAVESGQVEDDQRPGEIESSGRGRVEHPADVPVHETSQFEGDVAAVLEEVVEPGAQRTRRVGTRCEQSLDHRGHRGHVRPRRGGGQCRAQRRALAGQQAAAETRTGQRCQQLRPSARRTALAVDDTTRVLGPRVERVEADGATRPQGHRPHAPRRGQVPVLALRVHHPRPAAEDGLAPQEGLDERALPPADLTEDDHVGIGDDPLRVQLEGVEDERTPEEVVPDHHPALAQAGLGDEWVRRAEIARGDLMCGYPRAARCPQHARERSGTLDAGQRSGHLRARPRANGRVQV